MQNGLNFQLMRDWLELGLSIPRHFSFIGDSGNRGMLFFHSSGNGELKVIPRGIGVGESGNRNFNSNAV